MFWPEIHDLARQLSSSRMNLLSAGKNDRTAGDYRPLWCLKDYQFD
jgi:hypothetical protein